MLEVLRCRLRFDFQYSLRDCLGCDAYKHSHRILCNGQQSKISQTGALVCLLSIANRDIKPPLMFSQHDVDLESIPLCVFFFFISNIKIDITKINKIPLSFRTLSVYAIKMHTLYVRFEPSFHFKCLFDSNFPPSQ